MKIKKFKDSWLYIQQLSIEKSEDFFPKKTIEIWLLENQE
jgi:hypothetical protein